MVSPLKYVALFALRTNRTCRRLQFKLCFNWFSDLPSKTATGTIAIQVEDFNDHCPELTTKTQNMCFDDTFIYVTAVDKDEFPNSAPFHFTVIGDNKQKWTVEPLNGKLTITVGG